MGVWTTQYVYIIQETGEVIQSKDLRHYEVINKEIIYKRINETHTERIIIASCRPKQQLELRF